MEKTTSTKPQAKVSSAWTKLEPAPNKPLTRIINRKVFDGNLQ